MIDTPMMRVLGRFLDVNSFRHTLIVSNMANIDTPGYRTRDVNFAAELRRVTGVAEYAAFTPSSVQVQGLLERPDRNNVSLEREGLLLAETQLRYRIGIELLRSEFRKLSVAINEGK
ncbi:MAG: flagellar biosynthesis protein FlgB [Acidobacteria bacterium]|jgi:flagellar basal-body rod protein FlgB|nr:MAG: flagellar biosynthesis protein FlgB [Acidobacteriota bacterium]